MRQQSHFSSRHWVNLRSHSRIYWSVSIDLHVFGDIFILQCGNTTTLHVFMKIGQELSAQNSIKVCDVPTKKYSLASLIQSVQPDLLTWFRKRKLYQSEIIRTTTDRAWPNIWRNQNKIIFSEKQCLLVGYLPIKARYCNDFVKGRGYCSRESGKIVYWLFFQRIFWKNSLQVIFPMESQENIQQEKQPVDYFFQLIGKIARAIRFGYFSKNLHRKYNTKVHL